MLSRHVIGRWGDSALMGMFRYETYQRDRREWFDVFMNIYW
jgi:hypothetical protein